MEERYFSYSCRHQTETLLKVTLLHGCFSRFLTCSNCAKSCKASHIKVTMGGEKECQKHSIFIFCMLLKCYNYSVLMKISKSFLKIYHHWKNVFWTLHLSVWYIYLIIYMYGTKHLPIIQ